MKKQIMRFAVLTLVLMLGTSFASAEEYQTTIDGITYTLNYTNNGDGTATVSLNVSGSFDNGSFTDAFLSAIEIKVGSQTATVDNFTFSAGNWTTMGGPSNNSGCSNSAPTNNGFVCAMVDTPISATGIDITFEWELSGQNFVESLEGSHIGALYVDENGATQFGGHLLSHVITTRVAEPGSMLLLTSGLLGLGLVRRKLRK